MIKKCFIFLLVFSLFSFFLNFASAEEKFSLWEMQSVDTMKISRDKAREKISLKTIEKQLSQIKKLGANYAAIDTPYDEEFYPRLKQWADIAHSLGLSVWFRGNFSSWEGWFDYPKNLTRKQHLEKTYNFIINHPDLFQDSDSFTACPEAENGGPGDPRQTGDFEGHNQFIKDQYDITNKAFIKINKNIINNWFSMNADIAKQVLDKETVVYIGGLVTIDHFIKTPEQMEKDIKILQQKFDAQIFIGEFGAPIPDINGAMNEKEQAEFINEVFKQLYKNKNNVLGINYWVISDGTTRLLNNDGTPRQAVEVIKNYFIPGVVKGTVTNTLSNRLKNTPVKTGDGLNEVVTDSQGNYTIVIPAGTTEIITSGDKYKTSVHKLVITRGSEITQDIILEPKKIGFIYRIRLGLRRLRKKLLGF